MALPEVVILKSLLGAQGGLEKYALKLALGFAAKGSRTTLLTSFSDKRCAPTSSKCDILPLCKEGALSVFNIRRFAHACDAWLAHKNPAILFGLDRNYNQTHYRAGNGVHRAYLQRRQKSEGFFKRCSFALNPLHHTILKFEKQTFEDPRLKLLFTNSHLVKREILHYYRVEDTKICVVHNGVEWDELQTPFEEQVFVEEEYSRLLFIGNGYRRKGLDLLLKALPKVKGAFILTVIGKDKEEDYYKLQAKQLKLHDRVRFLGPQEEMLSFYKTHDTLLIPSLYDPFANVTLEALAMGLYVLTSSSNGASEIVPPQGGIVLQDIFNEEALIHALERVIQMRKTQDHAQQIRCLVQHLSVKNQLSKVINLCLTPATLSQSPS